MKALVLSAFVACSLASGACINGYRTLLDGSTYETDLKGARPHPRHIDSEELERKSEKLLQEYQNTGLLESLSDHAAILIYLGKYEEAINIFRDIETKQPGLYSTYANLGTVCELSGQLDLAIHYLKMAVDTDAGSHEGSEWIHIRILEIKKQLLAEPDYLEKHSSILGVSFGSGAKPVTPDGTDLYELERQLRFQLQERLTFVEAPDPVVGQLLFDLGNICAITRDVESALDLYVFAAEFGYMSELMRKRITALESMTYKAKLLQFADEHPGYAWVILISGILLIGFILFLGRKYVLPV